MSAPAEIPGFYYDAVKGRYFRLLPNHAAPTASFYSPSSVQKQQEEAQRIEEQNQTNLRRLKLRRKCPLSYSPFLRCTLQRELGAVTPFELEEAGRRVYALGLKKNRLWDAASVGGEIMAFACEDAEVGRERAVVIGTVAGHIVSAPATREDGVMRCDRARVQSVHHFTSEITSVCISKQRMLMATCLGGTSSPAIYRTSLPDSGSESSFTSGQYLTFSRPTRSMWTSTSSPHNGDMAVGTNVGVICIRGPPHDRESHQFATNSDVFAVEFLPNEPFGFVCGSRDGAMRLFDIRIRQREGVGGTMVVSHNTPITHIRALNDVSMMVKGLMGCALYDLRYPHPPSPSKGFAERTTPVKVYGNKRTVEGMGFDVSMDKGIVADAGDVDGARIFSAISGEDMGELGLKGTEGNIRALKFVGDNLVVAEGGCLEWYEM
ncbi:uncharacterized protein H6S33_011221 [Morchella sextelata]|uniref:uncharacterized protein n=1 Tax=Morchella sextelata TaxID=1174677 RepID=UPI001D041652|nr:uncharacterized protein H6S33_011221 [Morchella sextelata]KAH0610794.1 hypothetical protein H6S33_011221 [Morchella sextelata]